MSAPLPHRRLTTNLKRMPDKNQNDIDIAVEKMNQDFYTTTRDIVTQSKRLPYREYLRRRSLHWIEHVATDEDIEDAKTAILNRIPTPTVDIQQ